MRIGDAGRHTSPRTVTGPRIERWMMLNRTAVGVDRVRRTAPYIVVIPPAKGR